MASAGAPRDGNPGKARGPSGYTEVVDVTLELISIQILSSCLVAYRRMLLSIQNAASLCGDRQTVSLLVDDIQISGVYFEVKSPQEEKSVDTALAREYLTPSEIQIFSQPLYFDTDTYFCSSYLT